MARRSIYRTVFYIYNRASPWDSPITPATSTASTLTAPAGAPQVEPHTRAGISDSEAATMAGWIKADLAAGKMTQAQADQAFTELNTPLAQRGPDTRTDEQKTLDTHFPAAKPDEFMIRKIAEFGTDTKEARAARALREAEQAFLAFERVEERLVS